MTACVLACVASAKEKEGGGGGGGQKIREKRKGEEGDWGGEKGKQRSLSLLSSPVPPLLPSFFPRIFCPPPPPPPLSPFPFALAKQATCDSGETDLYGYICSSKSGKSITKEAQVGKLGRGGKLLSILLTCILKKNI